MNHYIKYIIISSILIIVILIFLRHKKKYIVSPIKKFPLKNERKGLTYGDSVSTIDNGDSIMISEMDGKNDVITTFMKSGNGWNKQNEFPEEIINNNLYETGESVGFYKEGDTLFMGYTGISAKEPLTIFIRSFNKGAWSNSEARIINTIESYSKPSAQTILKDFVLKDENKAITQDAYFTVDNKKLTINCNPPKTIDVPENGPYKIFTDDNRGLMILSCNKHVYAYTYPDLKMKATMEFPSEVKSLSSSGNIVVIGGNGHVYVYDLTEYLPILF